MSQSMSQPMSQPMSQQISQQMPALNVDRFVVIHVATTCDEHGVYVTKDSAEVIELGWILLDASSLDEVREASSLPFTQLWPSDGMQTSIAILTHA